jgi:chromate reductase, NAD(P)H dehydrogenase (quinone)
MRASLRTLTKVAARNAPIPVRPGSGAPCELSIPRAGDTVMPALNVLSICGSLRKGSYNAIVQRALPSLAPEGMTIKPAPSFAEFPLYNADIQNSTGFPAAVNTLADAIRAADGVIFCTPEYNFTIPGGLKNAIDWVSRLQNQPFAGKPVALQSASPGPVGGARVQYDIRKAMMFLDAYTLNKPEIFIGNCASKLDEATGEIKDETTRGFIKQQLASFVTYIARVSPKN